jgi:hypothetical protein
MKFLYKIYLNDVSRPETDIQGYGLDVVFVTRLTPLFNTGYSQVIY